MTSIKVELEGLKQLVAKLEALGDDADMVILKTITDLTVTTQALAKRGIQRGPKSGVTYRRGNVVHQASAPGQYPATDTGRLASSVMVNLPTAASMVGEVGTNVIYGPMLEFGTSRMAARPWLLPSFTQAKINVEKKLRDNLEARI